MYLEQEWAVIREGYLSSKYATVYIMFFWLIIYFLYLLV